MIRKGMPKVHFRFVPMGTVAPDPVPDEEIWLDVGNRAGIGVFDHHGGDTDARSASELVLHHRGEWIPALPEASEDRVLVLHAAPDLDAVCAAWLLVRALVNEPFDELVAAMVQEVSLNDQGLVRTSRPEVSWPIVMRIMLATEAGSMEDEGAVRAGMELLDRTLRALEEGRTLEHAARAICSSEALAAIERARQDYGQDLAHGLIFQAALPLHSEEQGREPLTGETVEPENWGIADALYLEDPTSILFKELARADKEHSPSRNGFALLLISRPVEESADRPLRRYIASTDPQTPFHLQGLGALLERREEEKEAASGLPLLPGRERAGIDMGRHGYGVTSPWYDGRGHGYTIVDSPAVQVAGRTVCASCLTPAEFLEVVDMYASAVRSSQPLIANSSSLTANAYRPNQPHGGLKLC